MGKAKLGWECVDKEVESEITKGGGKIHREREEKKQENRKEKKRKRTKEKLSIPNPNALTS